MEPPRVGERGVDWRICIHIYIYIYIYIYIVIVIVIVITTYHAVYWSYRASRADRWFLPRSIPWVPGLPEVADSMTGDPGDRGYRPTMLWGQWQLQNVSISNGHGRWPVCSPGVKGQGTATQQHSKGNSYGRKAATKVQSSTHAAKQEWTPRCSSTPATVETTTTRDPTNSIASCVLVIAHHP